MSDWWSKLGTCSNRGIQLIAILMAATLWTFVAFLPRMESDQRKMNLAVSVKHASGVAHAPLWSTQPRVVEVLLTGPKGLVARIQERDLDLHVLPSPGHRPGQPLPIQMDSPAGIQCEVTPAEVRLVIE